MSCVGVIDIYGDDSVVGNVAVEHGGLAEIDVSVGLEVYAAKDSTIDR